MKLNKLIYLCGAFAATVSLWENDVAGAKGVGMHQVFYNVTGKEELPFQPTYHISNLKELMQIL